MCRPTVWKMGAVLGYVFELIFVNSYSTTQRAPPTPWTNRPNIFNKNMVPFCCHGNYVMYPSTETSIFVYWPYAEISASSKTHLLAKLKTCRKSTIVSWSDLT